MTTTDVIEIAGAVIFSVGGGGALIFGLSNWLGKVWADRLMAREAARHNHELEELRANLQARVDQSSQTYRQKIELYKEVSNPLIDLIVKAEHDEGLTKSDLKNFDQCRLQTSTLLAMFAPKQVFDEYNHMIDFLYDTIERGEIWSFEAVRTRALKFLSLVRRDIGLYNDDVTYDGLR